jgi:hypothetical protein
MTPEKIIEHVSNEIQEVIETTMTFRTRIAFIAWIGPFILLGSLLVATHGLFRVPDRDRVFLAAVIATCLCYLLLGYIGARLEKEAWDRCNKLRQKLIQYSKLQSVDGLNDADLEHQAMSKRAIPLYMGAFAVILIGFLSVSIATCRIGNANQPQATEPTPKPSASERQPSPASPKAPVLNRDAPSPSPRHQ